MKLNGENLLILEGPLCWAFRSMGGEDGTDLFAATIAICDNSEQAISTPLREVIEADKDYFISMPYDASATAGQLRALADLLETYTHGALTCPECDELYNPTIGCCQTHTGEIPT